MQSKATREYADREGTSPECTTCRRPKAPVGRSMPDGLYGSYCNRDCEGYYNSPYPDHLWPGELQSEYGFGCLLDPNHDGECVFPKGR